MNNALQRPMRTPRSEQEPVRRVSRAALTSPACWVRRVRRGLWDEAPPNMTKPMPYAWDEPDGTHAVQAIAYVAGVNLDHHITQVRACGGARSAPMRCPPRLAVLASPAPCAPHELVAPPRVRAWNAPSASQQTRFCHAAHARLCLRRVSRRAHSAWPAPRAQEMATTIPLDEIKDEIEPLHVYQNLHDEVEDPLRDAIVEPPAT